MVDVNYLQRKKDALLKLVRQEDNTVWSGYIIKENQGVYNGYVTNTGGLSPSNYHKVFWIKIPKGATKIKIWCQFPADNECGESNNPLKISEIIGQIKEKPQIISLSKKKNSYFFVEVYYKYDNATFEFIK